MTGLATEHRSTARQFGDACEHYVVARLGFANVPAIKHLTAGRAMT
jgi:hypothetical protein